MTSIQVKINLDRYSPGQIMELCDQGIITVREIIESGVVNRVFGPELAKYVNDKIKEEKTCAMDVR